MIPFRSMQHMITIQDKINALTNAKKHLKSGGHLIFDVAFPKFESLTNGLGNEFLDSEWVSEVENGKKIKMFLKKECFRKKDQVLDCTLIFRVFEKEQIIRQESQVLELHFFSFPEIEALLQATGLKIVESYGTYDLKPLDENSSQMIFVLETIN